MNIRKLKERLITTLIGGFILGAWIVYAILTDFDFVAFITSPNTLFVLVVLLVPIVFIVSQALWGNKNV
jgi:hypothetical protein